MANDATKNQAKAAARQRKGFLFAIILVLVLVAFSVGFYGAKNSEYKAKVAYMKASVEGATKNLLEPIGGVERQNATVTQGANLPVFACIDVSCPTVETRWHLLANKNQDKDLENQIKNAILAKSGSSKWTVNLVVGVLGKSEQPYAAPSGKEWFNVSIWVTSSPDQL